MLDTVYREAYDYVRGFVVGSINRFQKLKWVGKLLIILLILSYIALAIVVVTIGPATLFQYFFDLSQELRRMKYGWLILGSMLVLVSFPPMVGFNTVVSICGFAWGVKGFLLAGPGAILGACLCFLSFRVLFHKRLRKLQQSNTHWRALDQVVAVKGLPLMILIRFSPMPPWVYSNVLFASIPSVKFWQFFVVNICLMPKVLLTVFVASRVAALADRDQRGRMDTPTEILNYSSVAVGILVGVGTGWIIYRLVQEKIRTLPDLPRDVDEAAAEALANAEQGAPLLRDFSPEPEDDDNNEQEFTSESNTADADTKRLKTKNGADNV